jgi:uncharacterized protein (TIGR03067 family)
MQWSKLFVVAFLFHALPAGGLVLGADSGPTKPDVRLTDDLASIQGEWTLVGYEKNGQLIGKENYHFLGLMCSHDIMYPTGKDGRLLDPDTDVRFELNLRTQPSTLTMKTFRLAPIRTGVIAAYRIRGDVLQLCFGTGGKLPTTFTTKTDDGQTLYTFVRFQR